jgi:hypothetical protein
MVVKDEYIGWVDKTTYVTYLLMLSPRPLETVHASKGGLAQGENVCLCLETY